MAEPYKELRERTRRLVIESYRLTNGFPQGEMEGLALEIRNAATTIGGRLARAKGQGTYSAFRTHAQAARRSAVELLHLLLIAKGLGHADDEACEMLSAEAERVAHELSVLMIRAARQQKKDAVKVRTRRRRA